MARRYIEAPAYATPGDYPDFTSPTYPMWTAPPVGKYVVPQPAPYVVQAPAAPAPVPAPVVGYPKDFPHLGYPAGAAVDFNTVNPMQMRPLIPRARIKPTANFAYGGAPYTYDNGYLDGPAPLVTTSPRRVMFDTPPLTYQPQLQPANAVIVNDNPLPYDEPRNGLFLQPPVGYLPPQPPVVLDDMILDRQPRPRKRLMPDVRKRRARSEGRERRGRLGWW